MKKIDVHLHVAKENLYQNERLCASGAAEMVSHMEELGIEKGILMSGGETGGFVADNRDVQAICERYPEHFAWMCNVDERDEETLYDRLVRCKKQGAVGIGEIMINQRIDHPFLDRLFAAAQELELPVTIHMSPEVGFNYGVVDDPGLPLLEQLLIRYPRLKVLGHSQVFWIEMSKDAPKDPESRNKWGDGPVVPGGRIPELFAKYNNLYGDLSANSAGRAIMRDPAFGLAFLEQYKDRLFFATDMINANMVYPLGAWLDEQASAGNLSQAAYEKICRGNANRVFGI